VSDLAVVGGRLEVCAAVPPLRIDCDVVVAVETRPQIR
jgi:hypothetical protein